jgi:hypothetical protein
VPVDLAALCALGCLSAVAGPRFLIRRDIDWIQPLVLHIICAIDSGGAKSPAVNELVAGLEYVETRLAAAHLEDVLNDIIRLEHQQSLTARNAAVSKLPQARQAILARELKEVDQKLKALKEDPPPPPRILIDGDITPEKLASRLAANHGCGAIIDHEGTLLRIIGGDMYGKGRTGNSTAVLKGYDGDRHHPDRVGDGKSDPVRRAILPMFLAPQPSILATTLANEQLATNGVVNRNIICVPGDLAGQRENRPSTYYRDASDEQKDLAQQRFWADLLWRIAKHPVIGANVPAEEQINLTTALTLDLTREAWELHRKYEAEFELRIHPNQPEAKKLKAWGSKHLGRVLRIAGILHLAGGQPSSVEVDVSTMQCAIDIGEWTVTHYLAAGAVSGLSDGAGRLAEYVDASELGMVNRWDIGKKAFNGHATAQGIDGWIAELVATGRYQTVKQPTSGRPKLWVARSDVAFPSTGEEGLEAAA